MKTKVPPALYYKKSPCLFSKGRKRNMPLESPHPAMERVKWRQEAGQVKKKKEGGWEGGQKKNGSSKRQGEEKEREIISIIPVEKRGRKTAL